MTKGSLDAPSTCSKNGKEEFYSHTHAANSHSLTSGSSNQDELLRAYEYARRHPGALASLSSGAMHYDAPDDGSHHTTESEGSTDPGIRQFTESPPRPNERRQAACITPGSGGGALSKENSSSSNSSSDSSISGGGVGLGRDGGTDEATPVNTPSQGSSSIPACFAVWDRAPLPGRPAGLVVRAGHLPQSKGGQQQQPLPPPPLPTKKGSVLSASTPAPTAASSAAAARSIKKGWASPRLIAPRNDQRPCGDIGR